MKHVFFIQSPITYIVSESIIENNNLNEDDIVYFVKSHYKLNNPKFKDCFDFEGEFRKLLIPRSFISTIFNDKEQYKNIDKLVESYIKGDKFKLYIPNVFTSERQALINHSNCIQVNFIEEGLMAYSYSDTYKENFYGNLKSVKKITALYSRLLFLIEKRRQFAPKNFYDISVINKNEPSLYYGFSEFAFQKYTNKNVVVLPLVFPNKESKLRTGSHIIVFDTLLENRLVEDENFYASVRAILINMPKSFFLKFHPLQSDKIKNFVIEYCKKEKIEFDIIDNDIPFEEYILNSENLTIHGYISSLLFYAKLFKNHNIISYISDFKNDSRFKIYQSKQDFDINELLSIL